MWWSTNSVSVCPVRPLDCRPFLHVRCTARVLYPFRYKPWIKSSFWRGKVLPDRPCFPPQCSFTTFARTTRILTWPSKRPKRSQSRRQWASSPSWGNPCRDFPPIWTFSATALDKSKYSPGHKIPVLSEFALSESVGPSVGSFNKGHFLADGTNECSSTLCVRDKSPFHTVSGGVPTYSTTVSTDLEQNAF